MEKKNLSTQRMITKLLIYAEILENELKLL